MGKINLAPLRVRKRALANLETGRGAIRPKWIDIVGDIPPAQILTRQQPQKHETTQIRTRILPNGRAEQYASITATRRPKSAKPSRLFAPVQIGYEEDELRRQFFSDHPWELARPRVVLETTGNQHKDADWSRGLIQPGIPLSGESVVQRQLWLLHHTPEITIPQAYDIARKEFYIYRRQEETRRRISKEEAEHNGAEFTKTTLEWGMQLENKQYDDWEKWSREQIVEMTARATAFSGETMQAEQDALANNDKPADPFALEAKRRGKISTAA